MGPEVLASCAYSDKCDVWAVGCMLYLMLTGRHPFVADRRADRQEVQARLERAEILDHPNWAMALAPARDLAVRLLAKDPARRLGAADALRHAWLASGGAPGGGASVAAPAPCITGSVFEGLGRYQAASKLKRAVLRLLAKEVDEARVQELRRQFEALDARQDGLLSRDEILRGMRRVNLGNLTPADLAQILPGSSSHISYTDFMAAVLAKRGFGRAELLNAFRRLDVRGEGRISLEALGGILRGAGPASCLEAFQEADVGRDGAIDFEEPLRTNKICNKANATQTTTVSKPKLN